MMNLIKRIFRRIIGSLVSDYGPAVLTLLFSVVFFQIFPDGPLWPVPLFFIAIFLSLIAKAVDTVLLTLFKSRRFIYHGGIMANLIYLSVTGEKQGLISTGCSSLESIGNKYQSAHKNEIFVYELINNINRAENISLLPVEIKKPIDKATPLLAQSINDNEKLECVFSFYRTEQSGGNELYFKMKLRDAFINNIRFFYPNSLTLNEVQPQESVSFKFACIEWEHVIARTSSYMFW